MGEPPPGRAPTRWKKIRSTPYEYLFRSLPAKMSLAQIFMLLRLLAKCFTPATKGPAAPPIFFHVSLLLNTSQGTFAVAGAALGKAFGAAAAAFGKALSAALALALALAATWGAAPTAGPKPCQPNKPAHSPPTSRLSARSLYGVVLLSSSGSSHKTKMRPAQCRC